MPNNKISTVEKDNDKGKSTDKERVKEKTGRILLTRKEKAALAGLKEKVGFSKKSREEQKKMLPSLIELVRSNEERRGSEMMFARNVFIASKHEGKVRFKMRWRFYTFLITAVLMLLLTGYLLYAYVFVIEGIEVSGNDRYTSEEIVKVSGIEAGDRLFSPGISEDEVEEKIVRYFPYIKSVSLKRVIPKKVLLEVEMEEPVFYSEIYGEWMLISAELRVIDITEEKPEGDYIKLTLPAVKSAVAGKYIEFKDDMFDVAITAARAVTSEAMEGKVSVLNLADRFSIYISYGGRFKLMLGDITDIELKLTLAEKIMQDEIFSGGNKGTIYLDNVNSPSAIIDNEINLD